MVCHFNKGIKIFIIFISASTDFAVQALERGPGGVKLSLYITFSPSLSLFTSPEEHKRKEVALELNNARG